MKNNRFTGKNIAILGFGIEGKDAAVYLADCGAKVTILDKKDAKDLDFSGLFKTKFKIKCGMDYLKEGLLNYDIIIRSPGIYRYRNELVDAEGSGVEITSVTKLFFELSKAKIIGVTGTKGKGTTSTLIYEILKKQGYDVYLGGNIGNPLLSSLPNMSNNSLVVMELSSFQLIDLDRSPHIAVILNVTFDHLDWHKDKNEYIKAKSNLVLHQNKHDYKVINSDYKTSRSFEKLSPSGNYYFSLAKKVNGVYVKNNKFYSNIDNKLKEIGPVEKLLLRGRHNWENICAAICVAGLVGVSTKTIKEQIFSFKGLEHRLEYIGTINGINYYDDSFSTNPQTTIAAINSFDEPLTLILGGFDKKLDYTEMASVISGKNNIKNIILIGNIMDKIGKSLTEAKYKGKILRLGKTSMKEIVKMCTQYSFNGDTVLLSPATSSFDMFVDYKDRGNKFKTAVRKLPQYTK